MTKHGLGKGLEALFPASTEDHQGTIPEISLSKIAANPFQPRRVFDEEALEELAASIKQYGVLQPVVVRQTLSGYELVAGERRWRAAQIAGLEVIPALVKNYTDGEMTEIALIENLQRENLNPIEEAMAYRRLMNEFGLTQEEVSQKIGRSRSLIANMVRLLNLPDVIRDHVSRGTISMGQARPLLTLESSELQLQAMDMIIENDLSARDVEELVKKIASNKKLPEQLAKQKQDQEQKEYYVIEVEDQLKLLLGTQVRIKPGKLKSKIEIEYYSPDDLERLLELFQQPEAAATVTTKTAFVV
jgi:ParB family chromosome partitioning protein